MKRIPGIFIVILFSAVLSAAPGRDIVSKSGIQGGLVVHIGCGNGEMTATLHANDRYLVHGLDRDEQNVRRARQHIHSLGLYGQVSIDTFDGRHLPYADNLVNLLVAEDLGNVPMVEVTRVLVPRGEAYIKQDGKWSKIVKPWPEDIDEWTHFLHGPDNNAVARDRRVGSPRHLQWQGEPKRTRDHDALASLSAMTSSQGRLFYILDEGPTSIIHRPAKWRLVARDAFNGKLLWKRNIDSWVTHLHYFRTGPVQLPRRLVSVGDQVYVTLSINAPVTALDAAAGRTILTYEGSEKTEELIYHNDILLTVIGDPNIMNYEAPKVYGYWELSTDRKPDVDKSIVAYQASTAKVLWQKTGENLAYLVPLSLAAHEDNVFFLDNENLHCVNLKTGKDLWSTPFPTKGLFLRSYAPTVVAYDDVVMCLTWNRLCSFSSKDGRKLWEHKGAIGFASPGDLFAIDGLAWTIPMTAAIWKDNKLGKDGKIQTGIPISKDNFIGNGGNEIWGVDIHTGQVIKSFPINEFLPGGHHHRCYRNKATERYLICGRRGLEYIDLQGDDHVINWWVRGVCQYGVMPCNGLVYSPPTPCQCFNLIKFDGFHALSARTSLDEVEMRDLGTLQQGPAYGRISGTRLREAKQRRVSQVVDRHRLWSPPVANANHEEWPTYRHDISRSGYTTTRIPDTLEKKWEADVGGRLSSVVVAAGRLFVSSIDRQTLHCLDATSGKLVWQFIAGGRIDSPPSIFGGMAVFGSCDGSVYAVRVDDGQLVWRFLSVPVDRRIVVGDRLESVWPVHGSVVIQDGVVYFGAGRSSFLDGGIRLYGLDAWTGKLLYKDTMRSEPTDTGGALPDVLISDGQHLNMRHVQYDTTLARQDKTPLSTIVANSGLLEDTWGHRWNWSLGSPRPIAPNTISLAARDLRHPFGKLIVFNETIACGAQNLYTFQKYDQSKWPSTHTGHLHQKYARYDPQQFPVGTRLFAQPNKPWDVSATPASGKDKKSTSGFFSTAYHKWTLDTPLQIRAMILAGGDLFVVGWRDAVKIHEDDPADDEQTVLWHLHAEDGEQHREYPLDAPPVFDGMAAAYGRLYLATQDGRVLCLAGES